VETNEKPKEADVDVISVTPPPKAKIRGKSRNNDYI
jgi:hypothetical protein